MNLDLDFIDFPTGFAIQKNFDLDHHPACSQPVFLCDCDAMPRKWAELKSAHDGSDGAALAAPYLKDVLG